MIRFTALPTDDVRAIQDGGPDAYGNPPEHMKSVGDGNLCRHCLNPIADGDDMLVIAHRPFPSLQPYAETGPIFLCAHPCERGGDVSEMPAGLNAPDYLVKGYSRDNRIVYGTGGVVASADVAGRAADILQDPEIEFVHIRSSRNNCYQARVDRG